MTSENIYYFIDTDAATKIKREFIQTPFFRNYCALTEENIYELRDNNNVDLFSKCKVEIDLEVIAMIPNVWNKVEDKDNVFNLYLNEGNGDIIIIATLLAQDRQGQKTLFKNTLILVTDDKGLTAAAKKFLFGVITSDTFMKILETNK